AQVLATSLAAIKPSGDDPALQTQNYAKLRTLSTKGPMARLIDRLALACNPDDLAAVGPFERHVFRAEPTVMQSGFDPDRLRDAQSAFAAEQSAWRDAASRDTFPQDPGGRMVSDPRTQVDREPTLAGTCLEVKRGEMSALFMLNLLDEGPGATGLGVLSQAVYADPARTFLDAQGTPAAPAGDDPLVELGDAGKTLQRLILDMRDAKAGTATRADLAKLLANVKASDPLSWMASDILAGYAKASGNNVVAAVPDYAFTMTVFASQGKPPRVRQAMRALQDSGTLEVAEGGGWATVTPVDRYEAELDFTPREAMEYLLKTALEQGRVNIPQFAKYAYASRRLNRGGIGEILLMLLDRSVMEASDRTSWKALQLFGSLSPEEQAALYDGGALAYALMGPDQRRIIERMVYADRLDRETGPTQRTFRSVEPTDVYAQGVPATCTIRAKSRLNTVIAAYARGADGKNHPMRGLDVNNLAGIEVSVRGNPELMASYGVGNLVGYALGKARIVSLRVEVEPGVVIESSITVNEFDADATPVPWDKLPEPYAKNIAAAIELAKTQRANQPGRGAPPPL
ncbi:MAG TPA: hypothetical protein VKT78_19570, partial [Fimbriimonadaceae bacterium]|nr:hypothetical protein [Fimbriimonadaceae bacterium]